MEKTKQMKGGINKMKKTGMFLAVLLVASLFASSFALAESFALTGKAIGLDSNEDASISIKEVKDFSVFSEEEIGSITVAVDDSPIAPVPTFPGRTTIGQGWITTDDGRAAFIHGIWTTRKNSDGKEVAFGKLRVGAKTYKLEKVEEEWDGKTLRFAVHGADGITGKFTLSLKENLDHMKVWDGLFSFDGVTGDATLATKTHRVRKPTLGSGSGSPSFETESGDDSKVSFDNEAPAKDEKKGFLWRIRQFFERK